MSIMKCGGNAPSFFVENVLQILAILMLFAGITVSVLCLFVIDDKDVDALSWSRYYDVIVIGKYAISVMKVAFAMVSLFFGIFSAAVLWGIAEISSSLKKNASRN